MIKSLAAILMAVLLASCASTGGDSGASSKKYSGFLKDYSLLKEAKDADGKPVMRYVSPRLTGQNYQQVMLDPVVFYPELKPSATADAATLESVRRHLEQTLRAKLGARVPLAKAPGPGVARMRVAITSVNVQEAALKAYQYIPLAFVIHKVSDAATGATMVTIVFVEAEITDSVSGELLAEAVKQGDGATLNEGTPVTAADVVPLLDRWAQLTADLLATRLGR